MSKTNPERSYSEPLLSSAFEELARSTPPSAPPELGLSLASEFHGYHRRRKIIRRAAGFALALGLGAGLLSLRPANPGLPDTRQGSIPASDSRTQAPENVMTQPGRKPIPEVSVRARRALRASTNAPAPQSPPFLALPLFAFRTPQEELRIVRVEMPASSLRLLGAHVNDEIIARRVTADLLVGPDGTPYAFRLVS